MQESEAGQLVHCADCDDEIVSGRERSYEYSEEGEICFDCAIRRGGVYDEPHDRWAVAPAVRDLLEREWAGEPVVARHHIPGA